MDGLKCPFGPEEAIRRTTAVRRDVAQRTVVERVPSDPLYAAGQLGVL